MESYTKKNYYLGLDLSHNSFEMFSEENDYEGC